MSSDPANGSTFVRGRGFATASSTTRAAGLAETITFTPSVSGWWSVVVADKAGSGNLTLRRRSPNTRALPTG